MFFVEKNLNTFNDLRRFLKTNIQHCINVLKTIFYFNNINLILVFVKLIREF